MPIYDYECANCLRRFESIHGVHVAGPTSCPLCGGGPVRKAISAPAVHFKGSGWAKKERRAAAPSSTKDTGDHAPASDDATPSTTSTATATSDKAEKSSTKADKPDKADKAATDPGGD